MTKLFYDLKQTKLFYYFVFNEHNGYDGHTCNNFEQEAKL